MRDNKYYFGIKEFQLGQHRFKQKPKQCPDYREKARDFYEKKEKNNYMKEFLSVLIS